MGFNEPSVILPIHSDFTDIENIAKLLNQNMTTSSEPKRPCNSFILFRRALSAHPLNRNVNGARLSKESADLWRKSSNETRQFFQKQAQIERSNHAKLYPNFNYKSSSKIKAKNRKHCDISSKCSNSTWSPESATTSLGDYNRFPSLDDLTLSPFLLNTNLFQNDYSFQNQFILNNMIQSEPIILHSPHDSFSLTPNVVVQSSEDLFDCGEFTPTYLAGTSRESDFMQDAAFEPISLDRIGILLNSSKRGY
jgi:hypothetical protein